MTHPSCHGKAMRISKGTKVQTDPACVQGKRVSHAGACKCTYRFLYHCGTCSRRIQDETGEFAPYLLMDVFSI